MLKKYASSLFSDWGETSIKEFIQNITPAETVVDLGCGDAFLTAKFAKKAKSKSVLGIDSLGKSKRIKIIKGDLNRKLNLKTNEYNAVFSNFSIEHLYNTGMFISESHRILKKGGYTIVATDNMSSWANILALLLGLQPFTTTMGIGKGVIGNPFAIRAGAEKIKDTEFGKKWRESGEYSHNKVLSYQALIDSYEEYGFRVDKIIGVGYLPFKGWLSRLFSKLDKRHAHFLILKATKA